MNVYKNFFYVINYGLDNVTDAQPNYFKIDLYLNSDTNLNEYAVKEIDGDISKQKIISHLTAYLNLDKRRSQNWRINTLLTENIDDFYTNQLNKKAYGHIFSRKIVNQPVQNFREVLSIVLKDFYNNSKNTDNMPSYLLKTYQKNRKIIIEKTKLFDDLLGKTLNKKMNDYTVGLLSGIDLPYIYKEEFGFRALPFYFSTPEFLSKIKLNKVLEADLSEKISFSTKKKI